MLKELHPFIVVIEDNPEVRDNIAVFLSAEGCLINEFSNISAAMKFMKKIPIKVDIIIMNEELSFREWVFFKSEFDDEIQSRTAIHIYRKPVNLKNILQEIEVLIPTVR